MNGQPTRRSYALRDIEAMGATRATEAWLAINDWLSANVARATDAQLNRALQLRDTLERVVATR